MIVRENPSWLRLLFAVHGSGLRHTWRRMAFVTLVSAGVTLVYFVYYLDSPAGRQFPLSLTTVPFTLIGLALSIFLGFRNNASYDRFWEGRKLWGSLVNTARTFARQVRTLVEPVDEDSAAGRETADATHRDLVRRMIAYVHALRHHLRASEPDDDLAPWLQPDDLRMLRSHENVPLALLDDLGHRVRALWKAGRIHDWHVPVLDASLTELTAIQGGCERIRNTPIPFAYTVLIHRVVAFYCLFLPFGIVTEVGLMTPLVVLLISYAFFGLDDLGDEIEDPFGTHLNDLPLSAISRTIEINLLRLLNEPDIPSPLKPERHVLM